MSCGYEATTLRTVAMASLGGGAHRLAAGGVRPSLGDGAGALGNTQDDGRVGAGGLSRVSSTGSRENSGKVENADRDAVPQLRDGARRPVTAGSIPEYTVVIVGGLCVGKTYFAQQASAYTAPPDAMAPLGLHVHKPAPGAMGGGASRSEPPRPWYAVSTDASGTQGGNLASSQTVAMLGATHAVHHSADQRQRRDTKGTRGPDMHVSGGWCGLQPMRAARIRAAALNAAGHGRYRQTLGVERYAVGLSLKSGEQVHVRVVSCGGHGRYRYMLPQLLRDADAVLVAFSLTDPDSFASSVPFWHNEVLRCAPGSAKWLLGLAAERVEAQYRPFAAPGATAGRTSLGIGPGAPHARTPAPFGERQSNSYIPGLQYASEVAAALEVGYLAVTPMSTANCWTALCEVAEDLYANG